MVQSSISRSEQKKAQILTAAIDLFCGQGFPNTSMDEVAKKAGVSKQTVYSHFGSKDDLFIASIESKCVVHQVTDELFTNPDDPVSALMQFGSYFGEMIISPEALDVFKTCVAQSDSHPEISQLFFNAGPQHLLGLLERYFIEVEQRHTYRFGDCRDAGVRLCLMLFGEMRLKLELGLPVDDLVANRETYIRDTVAMFLRAYRCD
ncbi:TetR family transcriptional regulator [Shewanella colwelliana]|uniref:TetR family transcriptional regulator n=1 Tax=Shewanella colwelliana TaxID=23 RepID=A0A1E5IVQ8_SHECO|nr:TetR/AcrR family transcriptional regulator [Shewanella colwelliana]MDX1281490.1 TetR/AcrR family transcriptional regulator [Shewanella colwelliana]OEG74622.1 TetR family transcriptional regulator [Shewanella colwelliana]GIU25831.1 TetR family transcriptional regulator [Shewanella colwelliana]GIU45937.1 TetR family transcriptional regulator [Shewanella colwelliana]